MTSTSTTSASTRPASTRPASTPTPHRRPFAGKRFGQAVVDRLPQLGTVIVGGLLLCLSFPPFGWWYLAFIAFGLLSWVLTRESTTLAGGFGYGFLFGLAFYLPLLPWISGLVGAFPWVALSAMEALFPALFGLAAVAVRRLPGWPLWFAGVWAAQEWLKSTVPFGGFPWGVVAFGQTDGPLLPLAQLGGAPLLSFAVALIGFQLGGDCFRVVHWWRRDDDRQGRTARRGACPGVCISLVLLLTARGLAARPAVGRRRRREPVGHRGRRPGQRAAARAGLQRPAPRRARQPRPRNRCDWPTTCAPAVRRSPRSSSGRRTPPTSIRWPIPMPAKRSRPPPRRSTRRSWSAACWPRPDYSPENPVATNTVIVWNPGTGPGDRHDKQIVQPFGEYLPWRGFFRHLSSFADRAGYFVPGNGNGVVHAAGVPVGVTTCWEVIFDRAARESVRNGAQAARRAQQQRHLRSGDERAATGVRQVARGRTRPLRGRGRDHRNQRDDRTGRP